MGYGEFDSVELAGRHCGPELRRRIVRLFGLSREISLLQQVRWEGAMLILKGAQFDFTRVTYFFRFQVALKNMF